MYMFVFFVNICVCSQVRTFGDSDTTTTTTEFYDGEPEVNKNCDEDDQKFDEGNLGQIRQFPWIGVLKVHYHNASSFRVGATGVVLIKNKYSIANAYDLVNIPIGILRSDSKVMFIPNDNDPWECKVKDFMNHPEYAEVTFNTVGLLELEEDADSPFIVRQICWPSLNLNTANELYGIGYTDGKTDTLLKPDMQEPAWYHCAFAPGLKKPCTWENGMVVASNASGVWMLVGIIVRGLGCSSPARFLDFTQFVPWIDVTTSYDEEENNEFNVMRRNYNVSRRNLSVQTTKASV